MGNFGSPFTLEQLPPRMREEARRLLKLPPDGQTTTNQNLDTRPRPKPQPAAGHAPHEHPQAEAFYSGRVFVRITSYRCGVQCDPDNIVVKFHIDAALRHSGLILDDSSREIALKVIEKRVRTKKEEGVEIVITPLE